MLEFSLFCFVLRGFPEGGLYNVYPFGKFSQIYPTPNERRHLIIGCWVGFCVKGGFW
ncbi:hypothetical protein KFK09_020198 [Dendrobium nobile]|uniref:Uncharacterized protein n=1 Tax=Dendrobium nobile TaxID=94219 RepID=A0A8T3AYP5_DENNO|nr:hypothetical protein KFK09_020198 [Dendrobium nobile]